MSLSHRTTSTSTGDLAKDQASSCVRQATRHDEPAIAQFLERAYPERFPYKYPARWHWQFLENPYWHGDGLPIWLAEHEGQIVGQTCALIEPLRAGGRVWQLGWSVDTIVLPEFRGTGLGKQLQAANQAAHEVFLSLSMSPENRRIKERLGGVTWPAVDCLMLTIHVDPQAVARRCGRAGTFPGSGPLCRLVARMASLLRRQRAFRGLARAAAQQPLEFTPVTAIDAELHAFCAATSQAYEAIVPRDARWLTWKLLQQPHGERECFAVRKQRELVGLVAVRHGSPLESQTGTIVELLVPPESGWTLGIAAFATKRLLARGAHRVRGLASTAAHARALRQLGFVKTRDYAAVCHFANGSATETPTAPYFSFADQDLDQFPLA